MKKNINFFTNALMNLMSIIYILFIIFIIYALIFSLYNKLSFRDTLSSLKDIGKNFINTYIFPDDSNNVAINGNIDNDSTSINVKLNNNYYYKQLDDTSRIIYNSLEENIDNLKKSNYIIDFSTQFNDLLNKSNGKYKLSKAFQSALDAFTYDHPELFYIDTSKISLNTRTISIGPLKTYEVQISPKDNKNYLLNCFNSELDVDNAISQVENARDTIINSASDTDTYNKIKKIHDILVNSIEYDTTFKKENIYNIYGALIQKSVVCEGYAKVFKYMLDSLNIESILVSGTATNSSNETELHMWNYVKIDDSWYGVDLTWDDPIIIGGINHQNLRHDYFLKREATFANSHTPSGKLSENGMFFSLPALSYTNYKW